MNTNSNISPLVRSMISLLTLIDSDMKDYEMHDIYEDLYSQMVKSAADQEIDLPTELLYLAVSLSKYAMKQDYDDHDTIVGNFSSLMEGFAVWLNLESQDRTIYDSIDMECCFVDLINDEAIEFDEFD